MSGEQIVVADLLREISLILFPLNFEQLIIGSINDWFNWDLIRFSIAGLFLVAVGIFSGRFQYPLNARASPLDASWCTTPHLWSVVGNQSFSNLWQWRALVVPFEGLPYPFCFFLDKMDLFIYTQVPLSILSRICFSWFQPRFDAHSHPIFHSVQFHLSCPSADRCNFGIEKFLYH